MRLAAPCSTASEANAIGRLVTSLESSSVSGASAVGVVADTSSSVPPLMVAAAVSVVRPASMRPAGRGQHGTQVERAGAVAVDAAGQRDDIAGVQRYRAAEAVARVAGGDALALQRHRVGGGDGAAHQQVLRGREVAAERDAAVGVHRAHAFAAGQRQPRAAADGDVTARWLRSPAPVVASSPLLTSVWPV